MAQQSLCADWILHQEFSTMSKAVIQLLSTSAVVWKTSYCTKGRKEKEKEEEKKEGEGRKTEQGIKLQKGELLIN